MYIKKIVLLLLFLGLSLFAKPLSQHDIQEYFQQAYDKPALKSTPSNIAKHIENNSSVYLLQKITSITPLILNDDNATLYGDMPTAYFNKFIKPQLDEKNITYQWVDGYSLETSSSISKILLNNAPQFLISLALLLVILYSTGFFTNKAEIYKPSEIGGSFDDIIGQHEIKKELSTLIDIHISLIYPHFKRAYCFIV